MSFETIGAIATVVGLIIGIGIGWGSIRIMVSSLKKDVEEISAMLAKIQQSVTTLESNEEYTKASISDLSRRMNTAEVEIAGLKARPAPRRR